ncbi:MAG: Holliday junction branch migration protein RuvA [Clostridia bacterium]|nr:Holliday junction branch migration protein RuvA [Clostridia bacterium]
MYAYIKGSLEEKTNTFIVVENNGIGYKIFMSESAIQKLGERGEIIKIHTYYYVKEDNISLYGFLTNEELKMFELLLTVSGIGAKSAIVILSNITPSSFALAVITDDVAKIKQIPGIGPKTAQRIILELKDKLKTSEAVEVKSEQVQASDNKENIEEAISALIILGYSKKEIEKSFEKVDLKNMTTEEIIRIGLKYLGK